MPNKSMLPPFITLFIKMNAVLLLERRSPFSVLFVAFPRKHIAHNEVYLWILDVYMSLTELNITNNDKGKASADDK